MFLSKLIATDVCLIIFEGSPCISNPEGHHKAASTYSWSFGQKTSCIHIVMCPGDCEVSSTDSWSAC